MSPGKENKMLVMVGAGIGVGTLPDILLEMTYRARELFVFVH